MTPLCSERGRSFSCPSLACREHPNLPSPPPPSSPLLPPSRPSRHHPPPPAFDNPHHVSPFLSARVDLCSAVPPGARAGCAPASGPAVPAAPSTAYVPAADARRACSPLCSSGDGCWAGWGAAERNREDDGGGRGTSPSISPRRRRRGRELRGVRGRRVVLLIKLS